MGNLRSSYKAFADMKKVVQNVLSTALAGFFIVLPFGFIIVVLIRAFVMIRALGDRMAESAFKAGQIHPLLVAILAGLMLFLIFFLVGAFVSSQTGGRLSNWLEEKFLNYVPGYLLVKGVANGLMGITADQAIRPALLEQLPGVSELVFIIAELPEDRYTVFAPTSPNVASGKVLIVRRELIKPVEGSLMDVRETLSLFGMGADKLLVKPGKAQ